jgi:tetratricopeptide (TPR) repeat protein
VPFDWAMTQSNLGMALRSLGEREGDPARLEQAVAAYRAALQERTRERVPLQWARTQTNLGTALWSLGKRAGQLHLVKEALEVTRAARELYLSAAIVQYEAAFTSRIEALEAEIAALEER